MKWILITYIIFATSACTNTEREQALEEDEIILKDEETISEERLEETNWDSVDPSSPIVIFEEIQSDDIEVRADEDISIYSMDENILFETDRATMKDTGREKLDEVITSLQKRFPEGELAIRGYADARGSEEYNRVLSAERAMNVAKYIADNSEVELSEITVRAMGENDPVASNKSPDGRQQNRRVEIMVKN